MCKPSCRIWQAGVTALVARKSTASQSNMGGRGLLSVARLVLAVGFHGVCVGARLEREICDNGFCMYLTDGALVGEIKAHQTIDDRVPLQALELLPEEWLVPVYGAETINALTQQEPGRRRLAQFQTPEDMYPLAQDQTANSGNNLSQPVALQQNVSVGTLQQNVSYDESMSKPYATLEVDFAVLPHTGHVYFRALWEELTRIVTESRNDGRSEGEELNPLTGAYGLECGGINPKAATQEPNPDPHACRRIQRLKAGQAVLIQTEVPKTWINPTYVPLVEAPPVNPFTFFRKLQGEPSTEDETEIGIRFNSQRKLLGKKRFFQTAAPAAPTASASEIIAIAPTPQIPVRTPIGIPPTAKVLLLLVRNPVDCYEMTFRHLNRVFMETKNTSLMKWKVTFAQYMENAYLPYVHTGDGTMPRVILRYEDLLDKPAEALKSVLAITGVGMHLQLPAELIEMRVRKLTYLTERVGGSHRLGKGFHFVNKLPEQYRQTVLDTITKYQALVNNLGYFYYFEKDNKPNGVDLVNSAHTELAKIRVAANLERLPTSRTLKNEGSTLANLLTWWYHLSPDLTDDDEPNTVHDIAKHQGLEVYMIVYVLPVLLVAAALFGFLAATGRLGYFNIAQSQVAKWAEVAATQLAKWQSQVGMWFSALPLPALPSLPAPMQKHVHFMIDSYRAVVAMVRERKRLTWASYKLLLARYQLIRAEQKPEVIAAQAEWRVRREKAATELADEVETIQGESFMTREEELRLKQDRLAAQREKLLEEFRRGTADQQ